MAVAPKRSWEGSTKPGSRVPVCHVSGGSRQTRPPAQGVLRGPNGERREPARGVSISGASAVCAHRRRVVSGSETPRGLFQVVSLPREAGVWLFTSTLTTGTPPAGRGPPCWDSAVCFTAGSPFDTSRSWGADGSWGGAVLDPRGQQGQVSRAEPRLAASGDEGSPLLFHHVGPPLRRTCPALDTWERGEEARRQFSRPSRGESCLVGSPRPLPTEDPQQRPRLAFVIYVRAQSKRHYAQRAFQRKREGNVGTSEAFRH